MAYNFVRTSSQRISGGITGFAMPLTIAVWFRRPNFSNTIGFVTLDTISDTLLHGVYAGSNQSIRAHTGGPQAAGTSLTFVESAANVTADTWFNGIGRFVSNVNRSVVLNGVASGINNNLRNVTFNQLMIGAYTSGTPIEHMLGQLAEIAVWSVELNTDEINSLVKGFKAPRIRPQSLVHYVPLIRNIADLRNGVALTATNSPTVFEHPRVY